MTSRSPSADSIRRPSRKPCCRSVIICSSGTSSSRGSRTIRLKIRCVSLLDIGLTGAVTILTPSETSGVTLAGGEKYIVGENAAHVLEGFRCSGRMGLPALGARPETIITIVADRSRSPASRRWNRPGSRLGARSARAARSIGSSPISAPVRGMPGRRPRHRRTGRDIESIASTSSCTRPTGRQNAGPEEAEFEIDARARPDLPTHRPPLGEPPPRHSLSPPVGPHRAQQLARSWPPRSALTSWW